MLSLGAAAAIDGRGAAIALMSAYPRSADLRGVERRTRALAAMTAARDPILVEDALAVLGAGPLDERAIDGAPAAIVDHAADRRPIADERDAAARNAGR